MLGKDQKFIASDPSKHSRIWHVILQYARKRYKYTVSHIMTVYIIYKLERIKISDHQHSALTAAHLSDLLI